LKAGISVANDELKVAQTEFDNTAKAVSGLEDEMDKLDITLGGVGTGGGGGGEGGGEGGG